MAAGEVGRADQSDQHGAESHGELRRLAVGGDVLGEACQRPEDAHVVFVVGAELEAVALRDDERHFEDVDRVEAEAFAVERRFGIDRVGRGLEVERFDQNRRDLALQIGLYESLWVRLSYSIRAPEALTTFSYLPSSLFTNAANRSGGLAMASANRPARRAFSSLDPIASTNALFSRAVDLGRQMGRAEDAEPGVDVEAAEAERLAGLGDRRHVGHRARALAPW